MSNNIQNISIEIIRDHNVGLFYLLLQDEETFNIIVNTDVHF